MHNRFLKLMISAGERSGDEHATEVLQALFKLSTDHSIIVKGMGGRKLKDAGMELVIDCEKKASVMGFKEVLSSLKDLYRSYKKMESLLSDFKPDALLVVDFADFNMRLVVKAQRLGVKVLYYIPPQVWAWREGRIATIKSAVDKVALIFPFEKSFYKKHGFTNAIHVGHPFVTRLSPEAYKEKRESFLKELGLSLTKKTVAIFPGSRKQEVEKHLSPMLEAIEILRKKGHHIQAVIAKSSSVADKYFAQFLCKTDGIAMAEDRPLDVLGASDVGIIKSGTSVVQAAFFGLPCVMVYKTSSLSATIARLLVSVRDFSMVNLLRKDTIRELLQQEVTGENIAGEIEQLLFDQSYQKKVTEGLKEVVLSLSTFDQDVDLLKGATSASERTAKILLDLMHRETDANEKH